MNSSVSSKSLKNILAPGSTGVKSDTRYKQGAFVGPASDLRELSKDISWLMLRLPPKNHALLTELAVQGITEEVLSDLVKDLARLGLACARAADAFGKESA